MARDLQRELLSKALGDVSMEMLAQDRVWGLQRHPFGTGPVYAPMTEYIKARVKQDEIWGSEDWTSILFEEVFEFAEETEQSKMYDEMKQVVAVGLQIMMHLLENRKNGEWA